MQGTKAVAAASTPLWDVMSLCREIVRALTHLLSFFSPPPLFLSLSLRQVPEQDNGCDCGLYLLTFAERFAKLRGGGRPTAAFSRGPSPPPDSSRALEEGP